ncbi:MAG: hypothetical protein QOF72_3132 [Blastocatellia bacterium]|jgi:hypothetical protein|nr:hypothetical protein [Blastocatellia bacterium]
MSSIKKQARFAGLLYLLACLPAPFALVYVPGALIVPGDATATADRVRTSETLLRLGIAAELLNAIAFIFVVFALYRLFKGVKKHHAAIMVTLFVVSVPISFLNVLNDIAPLILVSGANYLSVFDKNQLDALVYLFLRLHSQGLLVAQIFWGLWLFPFGVLAIRSGFIPRVVGVLVMIAGCGYLISSFTSVLLPHYAPVAGRIGVAFEFCELSVLWLLVWGAKDQPLAGQHPAPAMV